jgi:HSP20 family protein
MAIVRWEPFRGLMTLQDEMNRLFESTLFGENATSSRGGRSIVWAPPIDVVEGKDKVIVNAELPGIKPDEVELSVEDGVLTIKGERKFSEEMEGENLHRIERAYGYFERRIGLPKTLDPEKISAAYADGVLHIELPKAEETKPKHIPIKVDTGKVIEAKAEEKKE